MHREIGVLAVFTDVSLAALATSPTLGGSQALALLDGYWSGVIEVPGGVSIKGGRPNQSSIQLGSSTLADPATGLVHVNLPDDAVDSVDVLPNPYAVEFGRFSSGLVVIQTKRAGDEWKLRLNNLDPTFRTKRHQELFSIKGIESFGPRIEAGGPLVKNRVFLEESAQYRYGAHDVPSRPEDELMTSTSEIVANCFSSGVATEEAMFSGLAPGSTAVTWIVGVSNCGSAAIGMPSQAKMPATTAEADSSTVMTGRRMKISVAFTACPSTWAPGLRRPCAARPSLVPRAAPRSRCCPAAGSARPRRRRAIRARHRRRRRAFPRRRRA